MRIALLTIDLPEANVITHRLLQRFGGEACGVLHSSVIIPAKSNRAAYAYLGRRLGLRYGGSWLARRTVASAGAALRSASRIAMISSSVNLARVIVRSFVGAGLYPVLEQIEGRRSDMLTRAPRWI